MDFTVFRPPERCLEAAHGYFVHDWPLRGETYRRLDTVGFVEYQPEKSTLFDSLGGLAGLGCLSVITGGAFLLAYLVYVTFVKDRDPVRAEVFASPTGEGHTILTVSSNRRRYAKVLGTWVRENL